MSNQTVEIEMDVVHNGEEFHVFIEAIVHEEERGSRDSFGAPFEPDEEEEIEICRFEPESGTLHFRNLHKREQARVEREILGRVHEYAP